MAKPSRKILIACGLLREAKLLSGPNILCVPGGGDAARLEAALEARAAEASMILSCGIAGALDPALKVGDVVAYSPNKPLPFRGGVGGGAVPASASLADSPHPNPSPEEEGLAMAFPGAQSGPIIGQDHIAASVAEKAALHAQTGALAVDMETHIAARVAARHGLPFAAIRVISDTAHEALPPAAMVGMKPDGSMALGKVLASLARNPVQLPALIRTGRHAEVSFRVLGEVGVRLREFVATTAAL